MWHRQCCCCLEYLLNKEKRQLTWANMHSCKTNTGELQDKYRRQKVEVVSLLVCLFVNVTFCLYVCTAACAECRLNDFAQFLKYRQTDRREIPPKQRNYLHTRKSNIKNKMSKFHKPKKSEHRDTRTDTHSTHTQTHRHYNAHTETDIHTHTRTHTHSHCSAHWDQDTYHTVPDGNVFRKFLCLWRLNKVVSWEKRSKRTKKDSTVYGNKQ